MRPGSDSVELALAQVGDAWTFLILREAFFGVRRFDGFQRQLSAAPTVITARLKAMVGNGLLDRVCYCKRPPRYEYRLTDKGRDLYPAIMLLMKWGDRWLGDGSAAPITLIHRPCGKVTDARLECEHCHLPIAARDIDWAVSQPPPPTP